ncbi:hypothetical protein V1525DRAFT_399691, partial [Lipomyces kononenkoae]
MSTTRPLNGFNICCTGVESELRNEILSKSRKMGATHSLDLTSCVTHMIVSSSDTPKYEYAVMKRPDVVFLRTEFVPQIYERWIAGDDIDIAKRIKEYGERRIFEGLTISLSNVVEPERSKYIKAINENGGKYQSTLVSGTKLLVIDRPEGQKYKFALQRKIRFVHTMWLDACLKRGAHVNFSYFELDLSDDIRGANLEMLPRKAPVQMPNDSKQNEKIFNARVEREASEVRADRPISRVKRTLSDQAWNSIMDEVGPDSMSGVLDSVQSNDIMPLEVVREDVEDEKSNQQIIHDDINSEETLFENMIFYLHGFNDEKVRRSQPFILQRGGQIVFSPTEDPTHVVVPYNLDPKLLSKVPESCILVSNWFLDQSIHYKERRLPPACIYSAYQGHALHSEGAHDFRDKKISISGFSGMERTHIEKFIVTLGAKYCDTLQEDRDLLVVPGNLYRAISTTNSSSVTNRVYSDKMKFAKIWKVPIVPDEWLLNMNEWSRLKAELNISTALKRPAGGVMASDGSSSVKRRDSSEHAEQSAGIRTSTKRSRRT